MVWYVMTTCTKKGMKYVRYFFNGNYSTYTQNEFEQKYEVKWISLDILVLLLLYPGNIKTKPLKYRKKLPCINKVVKLKTKTSKYIYQNMLKKSTKFPFNATDLNRMLTQEEFKSFYCSIHTSTLSTIFRDFQYWSLTRPLVTSSVIRIYKTSCFLLWNNIYRYVFSSATRAGWPFPYLSFPCQKSKTQMYFIENQ